MAEGQTINYAALAGKFGGSAQYQGRNVLAEGRAAAALNGQGEGAELGSSPLLEMLGPLAHPETLTDFARLLTLPVDSVRKAAIAAVTGAAARHGAAATLTGTGRALDKTAAVMDTPPVQTAGAISLGTGHPVGAVPFIAPPVLRGAAQLMTRAGAALAPTVPEAAAVAETAPLAAGETATIARPAAVPAAVPAAPPAAASPVPATPPAVGAILKQLQAEGLKPAEANQALVWLKQGVDPKVVWTRIQQARALQAGGAFAKLPSAEDVAAAVADRNVGGRWAQ